MSGRTFDPLEILRRVRGESSTITVNRSGSQSVPREVENNALDRNVTEGEAIPGNGMQNSKAELQTDEYEESLKGIPKDIVKKPVGPATLESIAHLQYDLALAHSRLASQELMIAELAEAKRTLENRCESFTAERSRWRLEKHALEQDLEGTRRRLREALNRIESLEEIRKVEAIHRETLINNIEYKSLPSSAVSSASSGEMKDAYIEIGAAIPRRDELIPSRGLQHQNAKHRYDYENRGANGGNTMETFRGGESERHRFNAVKGDDDEEENLDQFGELSVSISPASYRSESRRKPYKFHTTAPKSMSRQQVVSPSSSNDTASDFASQKSSKSKKQKPPFIGTSRRGSLFRDSVFHVENKVAKAQKQSAQEFTEMAKTQTAELSARINGWPEHDDRDLNNGVSVREYRGNSLSSFASAGIMARQGLGSIPQPQADHPPSAPIRSEDGTRLRIPQTVKETVRYQPSKAILSLDLD